MPNRLKNYVRRTILEAAREYNNGSTRRSQASTESAFADAMRGTDTGWWNDLIYTDDVLRLAHKYRKDIASALAEYRDATGESYVYRCPHSDEPDLTAESILNGLMTGPYTLADYHAETERAGPADASAIGIRFAVEWYAGELAREYAPNL